MLDQLDAPSTFLADHATEADPSLLSELLTQHHRPFEEHADPRPMPNPEAVEEALVGAMNADEIASNIEALNTQLSEQDKKELETFQKNINQMNAFNRELNLLEREQEHLEGLLKKKDCQKRYQ